MANPINLPAVKWTDCTFDPVRPRATDRMEGRRTEGQSIGTSYWVAKYTPVWLERPDMGLLDAFMMQAGDDGETFLAHDVFRPRPQAYAGGYPYTAIGGVSASGDFVAGSYRRDQYDASLASAASVARAYPATYFDASGILQTAANNVLRLDHDPVTHAARGALIEAAATNIFTSAGGLAAYLSKVGAATVTAAPSIVGPAGLMGDVALVSGAADFSNRVERYFGAVAASSAEAWTSYVFVRAVTGTVTGILTATDGGSPNTGLANISVGTDWKLVSATQPGVTGASTNRIWRAYGFSGDVYIAIGGLNVGQMSSPIKTTNAAATRAADVVSLLNSGTNDWTLTYDDGVEHVNGVSGSLVITPTAQRWLKSYSAVRRSEVPAFSGAATLQTITNSRTVIVGGLPSGFKLSAGDYIEFRMAALLRSLHRIMAPATASGSGVVTLSIKYGLDTQHFTTSSVVNFEKAACVMQIDPGSYSGAKSWESRQPSFSATEVFVS